MEPVKKIEGGVSHLDRADVDTDQIIPKQFLKRVERTGFGSSREHAPWAIQDFGFDAVVAPSFADIFYGNCTKVGLLPVVLSEEECRAVAAAGEARIDLEAQSVEAGGETFRFEIDAETKHRLLGGLDDIGITLQAAADIDAFEAACGADRGPVTTSL